MRLLVKILLGFGFVFRILAFGGEIPKSQIEGLPGTVVSYLHPRTGYFIGSPSLAEGSDGTLYASHDLFSGSQLASKTKPDRNRVTYVYRSKDEGRSWVRVSEVNGQFWSKLLIRGRELYLLGTDKIFGSIVIRRSTNGGVSWTTPLSPELGLILKGNGYHTAPGAVVEYNGRLWKAFEQIPPNVDWGGFGAFLISAPIGGDLLDARKWRTTKMTHLSQKDMPPGENQPAILEGNAVITPEGELGVLYRYFANPRPVPGHAVLLRYNKGADVLEFRKKSSVIPFNNPYSKFSVVYDKVSKKYWAISNRMVNNNPSNRTVLALQASSDLVMWEDRGNVVEYDGDSERNGIQYPDVVISGEDLLVLTRCAFNGAPNFHDANYLLFHRVKDFRSLKRSVAIKIPAGLPKAEMGTTRRFRVGDLVEIPVFFSGYPDSVLIDALPSGLRYDETYGIITGVGRDKGKFPVRLRLNNGHGEVVEELGDLELY